MDFQLNLTKKFRMLHSMTGYGKSTGVYQDKKISVEIKALNSKSLDLFVRLPSVYREKELEFRQYIGQELERGKIEVQIQLESTGTFKSVEVNKELAKAYYADLKATNDLLGIQTNDYLSLLLKMPEILAQSKEGITIFYCVYYLITFRSSIDSTSV